MERIRSVDSLCYLIIHCCNESDEACLDLDSGYIEIAIVRLEIILGTTSILVYRRKCLNLHCP
jgi:hypothetical protein